jgi:hypothetical protein
MVGQKRAVEGKRDSIAKKHRGEKEQDKFQTLLNNSVEDEFGEKVGNIL